MTFDSANQLATFNGQTITHDLDGNMVSGPLPRTGAMGNYTYDSRNRLTGAGGFAYRYNAEGNRVGLTSANETTTLTVDPQGALPKVLERVKNGVRTRYVYGAGLQYEVNDAGAATYYHYDQSGNTAALTNQAGAIIERLVYSPYGTIRYRQSNFDTPFLYGGFFGVMSDANGLINMRARYYNPLTMRFLNSDPAMDGLNWYAYANGNPINFADPTGYGAQKVLGAMNSGLNALGMVGGNIYREVAKVTTKSPASWNWQKIGTAFEGHFGPGLGVDAKVKLGPIEVKTGAKYSVASWANLGGDVGTRINGEANLISLKLGNHQVGIGTSYNLKTGNSPQTDIPYFTESGGGVIGYKYGQTGVKSTDWLKLGMSSNIALIDLGGSINLGTIWQGISE